MQITNLIRFKYSWKTVFWTIVVATLFLLAATNFIFQRHVEGIDIRLDNLRTHETK